jgi:drug/metabolite transporter (DMT)-like permease
VSLGALTLVTVAALMHATWNALAKRALDPVLFLWASVTLACGLGVPLMVHSIIREGAPPPAGYPFIAATTLLHAAYFYALGRAYRAVDFSLVYPLVRGLGVALVPVLAAWALDERVSATGAIGIVLVVLGILSLRLRAPEASTPARGGGAPTHRGRGSHDQGTLPPVLEPTSEATTRARGSGLGWALLTGAIIAAYSVVDKAGVARVDPIAYVWLMGVGISLLLGPLAARDRAALRLEWAQNAGWILLASTLNLTGYLLVLFAFRMAAAGYVVATRELAIVFGAVIGTVAFKEPVIRLGAAAIIFAGVILIGLAR